MDIKEALEKLDNGYKVRSTTWMDGDYIYRDGDTVKDEEGNEASIYIIIDCTDEQWEIYREEEIDIRSPLTFSVEDKCGYEKQAAFLYYNGETRIYIGDTKAKINGFIKSFEDCIKELKDSEEYERLW